SMAATAAMPLHPWPKKSSKSISRFKTSPPTPDRFTPREPFVQIDRRLISHFDWTLFLLTLTFVFIGVVTIYSSDYSMSQGRAGALPAPQVSWLGLGLIAMLTAISFDYHLIDRIAYPFYGAILFLLILVLVIGLSGGGSQRWINLGF